MVDHDAIQAALTAMEAPTAAANAVAGSFGSAEAVPMQRQIVELCDVDYDALMDLAVSVLESCGGRKDGGEYTEGYVQGFLTGVLAERNADV